LLDFAGVLELTVMGRAFKECYERKCYCLVIDLANTDHASNTALDLFSQAAETIRHLNGSLVFVRVDGSIQIILDMMGMPEKFRFYDSRDEALQDVIESRLDTKRIQL